MIHLFLSTLSCDFIPKVFIKVVMNCDNVYKDLRGLVCMDLVRRENVMEVVRDAYMFRVLVGRGESVGEVMAWKMRSRYDGIQLIMREIPGSERYSELVTSACNGEDIDPSCAGDIDQFQVEAERYIALV